MWLSSLFGLIVSYEENEVSWILLQYPLLYDKCTQLTKTFWKLSFSNKKKSSLLGRLLEYDNSLNKKANDKLTNGPNKLECLSRASISGLVYCNTLDYLAKA